MFIKFKSSNIKRWVTRANPSTKRRTFLHLILNFKMVNCSFYSKVNCNFFDKVNCNFLNKVNCNFFNKVNCNFFNKVNCNFFNTVNCNFFNKVNCNFLRMIIKFLGILLVFNSAKFVMIEYVGFIHNC